MKLPRVVYGRIRAGAEGGLLTEHPVVAVDIGGGYAICTTLDKFWSVKREWDAIRVEDEYVPEADDDLVAKGWTHVLQQLAEAKSEAAKWEDKYLDADAERFHAEEEAGDLRSDIANAIEVSSKQYKDLQRELKASRDAHQRSADAHLKEKERAEKAEKNLKTANESIDKSLKIIEQRNTALTEAEARARAAEAHTAQLHEQGAPVATYDDIERVVGDLYDHTPGWPGVLPIAQAVWRELYPMPLVDPLDEQIDALADLLYGDKLVTGQMRGVLERVVRAGIVNQGDVPVEERARELFTLAYGIVPEGIRLPDSEMETCRRIAQGEIRKADRLLKGAFTTRREDDHA